jgi:hypothetical protein
VASEIVHIAGVDLNVHGRYVRQRCSWCGALLLDYDLARISRVLEPGEDPAAPWQPATFAVGAQVAVAGAFEDGGWTSYRVLPPELAEDGVSGKLAEGSCADLDPAVTA